MPGLMRRSSRSAWSSRQRSGADRRSRLRGMGRSAPDSADHTHVTTPTNWSAMLGTAGPTRNVPVPCGLTAGPASTAAWLRSHTRQAHAAAEAGLNLGRLKQPGELERLLSGWAVVWHAVLDVTSAPEAVREARAELLVPALQSVAWLQSDIADLTGPELVRPGCFAETGNGVGSATRSDLIDLVSRPVSVWGVAYVLLGSRLGGSVIAGQLSGDLRPSAGCGTAFLTSQGIDPGREWVAFRRRLDALGLSEVDLHAAGTAARWTFSWVGAVIARPSGTGTREGPQGLDRGAVGSLT